MSNSVISLLKDNFRLTNECIILVTPLVLFIILFQLYVENFQYRLSNYANYISYLIVLWVCLSAFFSGWFYMTKKTISFNKKNFLSYKDRNTELGKLFMCLFKGIGRFFLHFLFIIALFFIFSIICVLTTIYLYNSPLKLDYHVLSGITEIIRFLILYWFIYLVPEIVYSYNGIFKCIISSLKKAYLSFRQSSLLYIFIYFIGIILNLGINNILEHPFVYFIALLFVYYFILYTVLLIFNNYERTFIRQ